LVNGRNERVKGEKMNVYHYSTKICFQLFTEKREGNLVRESTEVLLVGGTMKSST